MRLSLAENDSAAVQVVRRQGNFYAVARYDFDIVLSHFA